MEVPVEEVTAEIISVLTRYSLNGLWPVKVKHGTGTAILRAQS
jgi:hypothetical protein